MASSSNSSSEIYQVFLSFRGDDSRKGFTGHLYKALQDRGVHAFMDDGGLEVGEKIGDNLLKAIEGSALCIPILSPGYATSRWCLMEVAKMVKCNKTILPIFYDVDPSDVRKQRGPFEAPFLAHEQNLDHRNKVEEWRKSLAHVGELKGFHLQNDADGYESRFILLIVKEILGRFEYVPPHLSEYLFGIDSRVEDMMKLLNIEDNDVRMIGIVGMGGIGKTTLSSVVYDKIFKVYQASNFLSDVREKSKTVGLASLQQTLFQNIVKDDVKINDVDHGKTHISRRFSQKKVLIVLDDVDRNDQLEALAGACEWFGSGSRIIITTRDEHVLNVHGLTTDRIYRPPDGLNDDDSLRLFSHHAFRKSGPEEEYMELSRRIESATGGLPLALKVFGSFLFDKRDLVQWEEQLEVWKGKTDIQDRLRISYDGLSEDEKTIFLDIACFFKWEDKDHAIALWKGSGLAANLVVEVLLQRSLMKIDKDGDVDVFWMHDLVRDMGRGIADQKYSTIEIHDKAIKYIPRNSKGSTLVEGIDIVRVHSSSRIPRVPISLKSMDNLRLLRAVFGSIMDPKFKHMPGGLRWLQWLYGEMKYLPNDFHLEKIVVLQLLECYSLTRLWKDWWFPSRKVFLHDLKVLNLRGCYRLKATPDFSACPNLEWLCLDDCESLVKLDESIGTLHWLRHLSLRNCRSLAKLPSSVWDLPRLEELHMTGCESVEFSDAPQGGRPTPTGGGGGASLVKKLRVLDLGYCKKLTRLPDAVCGETEDLIWLRLDRTAIGYLADSIGNCTRLVELNVSDTPLKELPASIGNLTNLTRLDISCIRHVKELPASLGNLTNLTHLDISCTHLNEVPASIGNLTNLTRLDISSTHLKELPASFVNLENLTQLDISHTPLEELPTSFGNLTNLTRLHISHTHLEELPTSFGNLKNLTQLDISCTPLKELPASFGYLTNLTRFDISFTPLNELPASFGNLTNLTDLDMSGNKTIKELPDSIGNLTNLTHLKISCNETIKELPDSIHLQKLEFLGVRQCHQLKGLPWEKLKSLRHLEVEGWGEERFKDDDFFQVSTPFMSITGHVQKSPTRETDRPFRRLQFKSTEYDGSCWELVLSSSAVGLDSIDAQVVEVEARHDWGCAYTGMQWLRFIFSRDFVVDEVIRAENSHNLINTVFHLCGKKGLPRL